MTDSDTPTRSHAMTRRRRLRRAALAATGVVVAGIAAAVAVLSWWPLRDPHPALVLPTGVLVVRDATVYPSPDDAPILHGTVVVRDGRIAAVGTAVEVPPDAQELRCGGCVVTAGFWNAHVHFTEAKWRNAEWLPAERLAAQLTDMLGRHGFTTVVDTGSNLRDTVPLRRRIETGELHGPCIYTAGSPQYPPHGVPFYVRDAVPWFVRLLLTQPETPDEAAAAEERSLRQGADLLKLFTGSYVAHGRVLPMPEANARAAVQVAHAHGQLAFSHPSNRAGVLVALHSGVDVLAHAPDTPDGIDAALIAAMVAQRMAMVPTLKMFETTVTSARGYMAPIEAEVRQFHRLGGELLFGTDVGYMADDSTEAEFAALARCGLGFRDVLRMLTTAPAGRFGVARDKGRVAPGQLADLVLLAADPATDPAAFAHVLATVRSGRVIYQRP